MPRPHGNLAHLVDGEVLARAGLDEDLPDVLMGEAMMGHCLDGPLDLGILLGTMRVPFSVRVTTVVVVVRVELEHEKVDDHEDAAGSETGCETLCRELGFVEVVEAQSHAGHIKVEELGLPECFWVFLARHADVAVICHHLVFREALDGEGAVSSVA